MSILLKIPRTGWRAARPSVREVRLLGGPRPGPDCSTGARLTLSGRAYRVAATQAQAADGSPGYVHLADEFVESEVANLKSQI